MIVRKINEAKRVVRETRDRYCNARSKAIGGISKFINYMGKDLYRYQY